MYDSSACIYSSMLGSILKQVISETESISEDIYDVLCKSQKKAVSGGKPQLSDIVKTRLLMDILAAHIYLY